MPATPLQLGLLPRNDVGQAMRFVREQLAEKDSVSPEALHVLQMLQDDPKPLRTALAKLSAERIGSGKPGL